MADKGLFRSLLFDYANSTNKDDRTKIEQQLWTSYGLKGAIFVLDMSGFSLTTQQRGIVYYLSMVHRMQVIVEPIVERYGGKVVKFEADNCFAHFPAVDGAVNAAIGISLGAETANRTAPKEVALEFSIGIDYGEYLLIDEHDYWGHPVNRASKLGEDLGEPGEILVTKEAMSLVKPDPSYKVEEAEYEISGLTLEARRIVY